MFLLVKRVFCKIRETVPLNASSNLLLSLQLWVRQDRNRFMQALWTSGAILIQQPSEMLNYIKTFKQRIERSLWMPTFTLEQFEVHPIYTICLLYTYSVSNSQRPNYSFLVFWIFHSTSFIRAHLLHYLIWKITHPKCCLTEFRFSWKRTLLRRNGCKAQLFAKAYLCSSSYNVSVLR